MGATPTDVKEHIYCHIRAGHHRIWTGELDGPNLGRWKAVGEPRKSPT